MAYLGTPSLMSAALYHLSVTHLPGHHLAVPVHHLNVNHHPAGLVHHMIVNHSLVIPVKHPHSRQYSLALNMHVEGLVSYRKEKPHCSGATQGQIAVTRGNQTTMTGYHKVAQISGLGSHSGQLNQEVQAHHMQVNRVMCLSFHNPCLKLCV